MEQQNTKKIIMRRVKTVYYLRKVFNWFTLKGVLAVFALMSFGSLVHVAAVFDNMPSVFNAERFFSFSYHAFMNTEIAVQAVILALIFVSVLLARDVVGKIFSSSFTFSHA